MPNPRNPRISDEDIAELYRNSLCNPRRFIMRFWDGIDYVTSRRSALRLTFVLICSVAVLIRMGNSMADERKISITNTGNAGISVVLNYREAGCKAIDLLPGGHFNASLREIACVVINDVENMAVFGQDELRLTPDH